ncbi:hypothetical protein Cal6303_2547 [Calothrix sp. PCC 6303]|nr:hypothetical protein Cal6303_2547 [Calothrix sp. PCC 6303]
MGYILKAESNDRRGARRKAIWHNSRKRCKCPQEKFYLYIHGLYFVLHTCIDADHEVAAEFFNLNSVIPGNLLVYQCQLYLMEKEY